jgi:hypothetical protein
VSDYENDVSFVDEINTVLGYLLTDDGDAKAFRSNITEIDVSGVYWRMEQLRLDFLAKLIPMMREIKDFRCIN